MRMATEQHGLQHVGIKGIVCMLGNIAALARQRMAFPLPEWTAADAHLAESWRRQSGKRAQKRCLAGTVGTEHAPEFAALRGPIEVRKQDARARAQRQTARLDQCRLSHAIPSIKARGTA